MNATHDRGALDAGRRATRQNPLLLEGWREQGEAELEAGDFGGAERAFRKVVEIDPTYGLGFAKLAQVLLEQERTLEALEAISTAADHGGDPFFVAAIRGDVYAEMERHSEAAEAYDDALKIDPEDHWALHQAAVEHGAAGHVLRANELFEAALKHDRDGCHQTLVDFGDHLRRSGRIGDAVRLYRKAVQAVPGDPEWKQTLKEAERELLAAPNLSRGASGASRPLAPRAPVAPRGEATLRAWNEVAPGWRCRPQRWGTGRRVPPTRLTARTGRADFPACRLADPLSGVMDLPCDGDGDGPMFRRVLEPMNYLDQLEQQSVYILREAFRALRAPVHVVVDRQGLDGPAVAGAQGVFRARAVPAGAHRHQLQAARDDRLPRSPGDGVPPDDDRRPGRGRHPRAGRTFPATQHLPEGIRTSCRASTAAAS